MQGAKYPPLQPVRTWIAANHRTWEANLFTSDLHFDLLVCSYCINPSLENTASWQEATKVGTVCIVRRICRPVFGKTARSISSTQKSRTTIFNRRTNLLSPKSLSDSDAYYYLRLSLLVFSIRIFSKMSIYFSLNLFLCYLDSLLFAWYSYSQRHFSYFILSLLISYQETEDV